MTPTPRLGALNMSSVRPEQAPRLPSLPLVVGRAPFDTQVDSIDESQPADYWRNVAMGVLG